MIKHGFVIGWVLAWFIIGTWKYYVEDKLGIYWNIAFFLGGLILGTIIQTLLDKYQEKNKENENENKQTQEPDYYF